MTIEAASVPVVHDSVLEMLEAEAIFIMRETRDASLDSAVSSDPIR